MARIISIVRKRIEDQRLYNLAVKDDESFVADGIVVHNCKSRLVPNNVGDKNNPEITGSVKPSESALKSMTL